MAMNVRRTAAAVVVAALVPLTGAVTAHAGTATVEHYRISAHASDTTPASGEQFVLRGTFGTTSAAAVDRPVKVQSYPRGCVAPADRGCREDRQPRRLPVPGRLVADG